MSQWNDGGAARVKFCIRTKFVLQKKRWQMQNTNCLRNDVIIIKVVVRGKKDGVSFLESLQSIKNLKLTFHTRLNYSFVLLFLPFFVQVICSVFFSAFTSSIEYGNEFFEFFDRLQEFYLSLFSCISHLHSTTRLQSTYVRH